MDVFFIADLHLTPDKPETLALFYKFLEKHKNKMKTLYILGDFFEYWIGDDYLDDWNKSILLTLKNLQAEIYFIVGNRDFLLSGNLLHHFNIKLLEDNSVININNKDILISHGDQLCTNDNEYQKFRKLVRTDTWQKDFLAKSLEQRRGVVMALRRKSIKATKEKQQEIMDVNENTVLETFLKYKVDTIIHGHTHRPAHHKYSRGFNRYVLASWETNISYIKIDKFHKISLVY